ncbi:MAG TPA: acyl-protein synthetase [Bacteroidia bacterium]|nr:acyl-protein synthetase [Bacteroidia bacterium]
MDAELFLNAPQYSLQAEEKKKLLLEHLTSLHEHHLIHSEGYKKICAGLFPGHIKALKDIPYLPVSVFKNHELKSIPESEVFKVLTSSGTTGSVPSKIYLDKGTAQMQTRALSNIMQYVLGRERLPMLIVDTIGIIKNRTSYSARAAGVLGLSVFGKSHFYLLNESMEPDLEGLQVFLEAHKGKPLLIFGFTFMVWQYLYEVVPACDLSGSILIHSGGWKKLTDKAVDNDVFKLRLKEKFNISKSYNFYGMVEQVGSVFLECEHGFLHAPNFADVLIRSPFDFHVLPHGEEGIIQVISILPYSYPGFSLLTEDLGTIHGEDNCSCGRKGKYFKVSGRMKKAELRGCSDTFTLTH